MPTDFHYVPPAPEALSGPSFIEQTEMAINELGGEIDIANNGAQEAITIANNALSTANAAQETAQDALSSANSAQNTADDALTGANNAQETADNAQADASSAVTIAQTAQSTAELAQTAADNALERANAAYDAVEDTQEIALNALTVAETAMGIYTVTIDNGLDANNYYRTAEKLYLTGSSLVNFPQGAEDEGNIYFEILVTDDNTSATQRVWYQDGETQWIRTAIIDNTAPENPIVSWTAWSGVGADRDIDISALKDGILSAITLNNADTDINLAVGTNGRYYIRNAEIPNLPTPPERCIIEVVSDTAKSNTFMRADTLSGTQYTRYSQSNLSLGAGTAFYTFTATSGTAAVTETIVFRADAQGNLSLRGQLGTGGSFSVDESVSSGVVIGCAIDFYSDNTSFRENGFTLTVVDESGGGSDSISVEFPPLGGGDPTITSDTATTSNSYIRYQSGEQLNAGGSEATIYITATWTNYTGTITWTPWELVNGSLASGTNFKGIFDASAGNYNAIENGNVGDMYVVSVGGTIGSITWGAGDLLILAETVTGPPTESQIDRIANPTSINFPITVAQGGTGVSSLTGLVKGNGTSAFTAAAPGTDYPTVASVTTAQTTANNAFFTAQAAQTTANAALPATGTAAAATKLATARNISITGGATADAVSFNGTAAVALNVTDLNMGNATAGTLAVDRGGTGQTTVQALRNSMGLGNTTGALPIANGGTGATTAAAARANLGIPTLPTNVAPLPQTATGVGQIYNFSNGANTGFTLPSGGTWFYAVQRVVSGSGARSHVTGIAAGGTSPYTNQFAFGWAWRIA